MCDCLFYQPVLNYALMNTVPNLGVKPYQTPNVKNLRMMENSNKANPYIKGNQPLVWNKQYGGNTNTNYNVGCYNNYANVSYSYMSK